MTLGWNIQHMIELYMVHNLSLVALEMVSYWIEVCSLFIPSKFKVPQGIKEACQKFNIEIEDWPTS